MLEIQLQGIPASPGIAMGPVLCFNNKEPEREQSSISKEDVSAEVARVEDALKKSEHELQKIKRTAMQRLGVAGSMIFEAQVMMLLDPSLLHAITQTIESQLLDAESAVTKEFARMETPLLTAKDSLLRERAGDIVDLRQRVIRNLQHEHILSRFEGEAVIVAEKLSPADAVVLSKSHVLAFVMDGGGLTSHAVILARSLNIPAVIGVRSASVSSEHGSYIIVDGDAGSVVINPSEETKKLYNEKLNRMRIFSERLSSIASLPATTFDNRHITLAANLDRETEIPIARRAGAEGIGLVRSETMLLHRSDIPGEQEQYVYYKTLAERMHPHWVTIRVFDIGADKIIAAFPEQEQNPALGNRGIRLLLENENIFIPQMRAIIRASLHRNVRILLPMVSSLEEVWQVRETSECVKRELRAEGELFDEHIPIGVMIEVPSAALIARDLANEADFLSIGTNDLTQYTLAVDRTNENTANLYEEFHPAVIRLIKEIIDAGHREEAIVSVCGELAGNPLATVLLVGLGVDELSVATPRLLPVKNAIRNLAMSDAERVARAVLTLHTASDVRAFLNNWRSEHEARMPTDVE